MKKKRKNNLFIIENGLLIDKLVPCRKISKDLYLILTDKYNRFMIEYYTYMQGKVHSKFRGLYNDFLVVDKYGKVVLIILKQQKNVNELIKRFIKDYENFKKETDYETYKLKRLILYVNYKIKIGEY